MSKKVDVIGPDIRPCTTYYVECSNCDNKIEGDTIDEVKEKAKEKKWGKEGTLSDVYCGECLEF